MKFNRFDRPFRQWVRSIACLFALAAAIGCAREEAQVPQLVDASGGVVITLPSTATPLTIRPTGRYTWATPFAPNRKLVYLRLMDVQPLVLSLEDRMDEINLILNDEIGGFLRTAGGTATLPDGREAYLLAGRTRDGAGLAGFLYNYDTVRTVFIALMGPSIQEEDARRVMDEIFPHIQVTPSTYGMPAFRALMEYSYPKQSAADAAQRIAAAQTIFDARNANPQNYSMAILSLYSLLRDLQDEGLAQTPEFARTRAALDSAFFIRRSDMLEARRDFEYACGTWDFNRAQQLARKLEALESIFDPDAKTISRARYRRAQKILNALRSSS